MGAEGALEGIDALQATSVDTVSVKFRRAMSCFATVVVVATTVLDGRDYVMTANSFTSVSLEPRMVLVCVGRGPRFGRAATQSRTWAVSVLYANHGDTAKSFATRGQADPLDEVRYTRGRCTGAALLADSIATFECRVSSIVLAGDRDIVIGDVLDFWSADVEQSPLVFYRGRLESVL